MCLSSAAGSWWGTGGGSGSKAPEKIWPFYIWMSNEYLKIEQT